MYLFPWLGLCLYSLRDSEHLRCQQGESKSCAGAGCLGVHPCLRGAGGAGPWWELQLLG